MMTRLCLGIAFGLFATATWAGPGGRLPATGGVSDIEGVGGGGLVPWALITGYGTRDEIGCTAFLTRVYPRDFRLDSGGLACGFHDRWELSFARQRFDLGNSVPGETISQDIFGLKFRLAGDAIFDDGPWPQLAAGLQLKHNRDFGLVPEQLEARHASDIDVYLAATKLWLAGPLGRSWLLDVGLRGSRANQFGLLGFGGERNNRYRWLPEASLAMFWRDDWVIGAEYRSKPDNLTAFREQDASDWFLAWFPSKRFSFTLARVDLGRIADRDGQQGWYLSGQLAF